MTLGVRTDLVPSDVDTVAWPQRTGGHSSYRLRERKMFEPFTPSSSRPSTGNLSPGLVASMSACSMSESLSPFRSPPPTSTFQMWAAGSQPPPSQSPHRLDPISSPTRSRLSSRTFHPLYDRIEPFSDVYCRERPTTPHDAFGNPLIMRYTGSLATSKSASRLSPRRRSSHGSLEYADALVTHVKSPSSPTYRKWNAKRCSPTSVIAPPGGVPLGQPGRPWKMDLYGYDTLPPVSVPITPF